MRIVKTGYNYCHSSGFCINRPHGSGDYLLLIIKTEAFIILNGEKKTVPPNCAIIFRKGTPQLYGAAQEKYINDWIHFEMGEEDMHTFFMLGIPFDTIIPLRDVTELSNFIKCIFFERYSQNLHKEATMKAYLNLIFLKLSEKINDQAPVQEHPYYHQFCTLRNKIRLEPQRDWSIDDICKKLALSRSYVQHLYKLFFGTSIIADVQAGRMEHAKYLLTATDMSVTVIASACGYVHDVHFMRVFKKAVGMTPSAYRDKFKIATNNRYA